MGWVYALMQPIISDFIFTRCEKDNFKVQQVSFYTINGRQRLRWMSHSKKNNHMQTQYNGREMTLGKRRMGVGRWDIAHRNAYHFYGCMFHGHPNCSLTRYPETHPKSDTPVTELFTETVANSVYLKSDYNVKEIEIDLARNQQRTS